MGVEEATLTRTSLAEAHRGAVGCEGYADGHGDMALDRQGEGSS